MYIVQHKCVDHIYVRCCPELCKHILDLFSSIALAVYTVWVNAPIHQL